MCQATILNTQNQLSKVSCQQFKKPLIEFEQ